MDRLAFLLRVLQICFDFLERTDFGDTGSFALFLQRRLCSHPDNCVDCQFVAKNDLTVVIYVDDGGQSGVGKPEEIQESGVLAEMVCVIGIVHAGLIVTQK